MKKKKVYVKKLEKTIRIEIGYRPSNKAMYGVFDYETNELLHELVTAGSIAYVKRVNGYQVVKK